MSRISKLKDAEYYIDFDEKEVFHGDESVARIQPRHLNILECLARNAGRLTKKETIISSCLEFTSDNNYYNNTSYIRKHIHEKVGESIEKCSGGFRYHGGPITEEDVRRIDGGERIITDKEDELLARTVLYKINKTAGRDIDEDLVDEVRTVIAVTIAEVRAAVWKDFEFRRKVIEVLKTYQAVQLAIDNDSVLSLSIGGK